MVYSPLLFRKTGILGMNPCDDVSRTGVNPRKRVRERGFSLYRRLASGALKYFGASNRAMTPQIIYS